MARVAAVAQRALRGYPEGSGAANMWIWDAPPPPLMHTPTLAPPLLMISNTTPLHYSTHSMSSFSSSIDPYLLLRSYRSRGMYPSGDTESVKGGSHMREKPRRWSSGTWGTRGEGWG